MIIGRISKEDKRVKFTLEIHCTECGKEVPGGLQSSERFYRTKEFKLELERFKENYLCGICRDKKRVSKNQSRKM